MASEFLTQAATPCISSGFRWRLRILHRGSWSATWNCCRCCRGQPCIMQLATLPSS